jgi:hypothetical protein
VLRLGSDDIRDPAQLVRWAEILETWIAIDRQNIVNRWAKVHWVHWPINYETNAKPSLAITALGFYTNIKNLGTSHINLLRSLALFRLELSDLRESGHGDPTSDDQRRALDNLILEFWQDLGPSARQAIRGRVPGSWPPTPAP